MTKQHVIDARVLGPLLGGVSRARDDDADRGLQGAYTNSHASSKANLG